ncbi:MAG: CvpA family protein [Lachnospiraceae bacterium]|nr:CvpA family protein [Lachnospiraceae bacterium]
MYFLAIGIVAAVFIWRIAVGFSRGLVSEIISLVSMAVAAVSLFMILQIISGYFGDSRGNIIFMVIVLAVIGLVYKIANLIFTSLKLIAKLPVISAFNRLLGAALGAVEAVLIIFIVIIVLRYFSFNIPV